MTTRTMARTGVALLSVATVAALWSGNVAAQSPAASGGGLTYADMTVGFIQTGSESGWRAANTASFKETAEQLGLKLKFYDAQNKLENQVSAFHQFNQDPAVDVIILAALDVTGYDEVLQEAQQNGKIVVLEDRRIDARSLDSYSTYIGSDFNLEGQKAATAMCDLLADSPNKKIVEITGAVGASAAIDRAAGFRERHGRLRYRDHRQPDRQLGRARIEGRDGGVPQELRRRDRRASSATTTRKPSAPSRRSRRPASSPVRTSRSSASTPPPMASSTSSRARSTRLIECNPLLAPAGLRGRAGGA